MDMFYEFPCSWTRVFVINCILAQCRENGLWASSRLRGFGWVRNLFYLTIVDFKPVNDLYYWQSPILWSWSVRYTKACSCNKRDLRNFLFLIPSFHLLYYHFVHLAINDHMCDAPLFFRLNIAGWAVQDMDHFSHHSKAEVRKWTLHVEALSSVTNQDRLLCLLLWRVQNWHWCLKAVSTSACMFARSVVDFRYSEEAGIYTKRRFLLACWMDSKRSRKCSAIPRNQAEVRKLCLLVVIWTRFWWHLQTEYYEYFGDRANYSSWFCRRWSLELPLTPGMSDETFVENRETSPTQA